MTATVWPPDGPGAVRPVHSAPHAPRWSCAPRPYDTDVDYARYHHLDLAELSARDLMRERELARLGYALAEPSADCEWWLARIAAVRTEIEQRRDAQ